MTVGAGRFASGGPDGGIAGPSKKTAGGATQQSAMVGGMSRLMGPKPGGNSVTPVA